MIAIKNVLVATDFSAASDTALTYGRTLARTFGSTLHVMHVVDDMSRFMSYAENAGLPYGEVQAEMEKAARASLETLVSADDRQELAARVVVCTARNIAAAIADYARNSSIDLIVIGATGRGAVDRILTGSVADKVIRRASCPVLAVRNPEHEFIIPDHPQAVVCAKRCRAAARP